MTQRMGIDDDQRGSGFDSRLKWCFLTTQASCSRRCVPCRPSNVIWYLL